MVPLYTLAELLHACKWVLRRHFLAAALGVDVTLRCPSASVSANFGNGSSLGFPAALHLERNRMPVRLPRCRSPLPLG